MALKPQPRCHGDPQIETLNCKLDDRECRSIQANQAEDGGVWGHREHL